MNDETKEVLEILEAITDDPENIRKDYSGRCMYGRRCLGVETNDPFETLANMVDYVRDDEDLLDTVINLIGNTRTDNMGLSTIMYWPQLRVETESEEG